jgi:hypothetical protein
MNIQQLQNDKLNIINWINQLQDYSVIEKVKSLMSSSDEDSLLDNSQKRAIDKGIESIENEGTTPHNNIMEATKKRFPNLYNR